MVYKKKTKNILVESYYFALVSSTFLFLCTPGHIFIVSEILIRQTETNSNWHKQGADTMEGHRTMSQTPREGREAKCHEDQQLDVQLWGSYEPLASSLSLWGIKIYCFCVLASFFLSQMTSGLCPACPCHLPLHSVVPLASTQVYIALQSQGWLLVDTYPSEPECKLLQEGIWLAQGLKLFTIGLISCIRGKQSHSLILVSKCNKCLLRAYHVPLAQ